MDFNEGSIPTLTDELTPDECASITGSKLSLDELEQTEVPFKSTLFNTCTRKGGDRRQLEDRRCRVRSDREDRRSGRERRFLSWN